MKHPFEIEPNAITFYPNHIMKRLGYILPTVLLAFSLGIFYYMHMLTMPIALIMTVAILVIFSPFIYLGSRSLTLNSSTGMITRRSLFGEKVIGPLSEFSGTTFVSDASYGNRDAGYYRLVYKERPFAKGIRLHTTLTGKSRQMQAVKATALPYLSQMLLQHATPQFVQDTALQIFKANGNVYTAKQLKPFNLVLAIVFIAGGLYLLQLPATERSWYWAACLGVGLLNLAMWSGQVKIDTANKIIEKTFFFGLYKKSYQFDYLIGFNTMRYLMYGIFHNGTDINMDIAQGSTNQRIVLFHRIQSGSKLEQLMTELHHIVRP